MFLIPKIDVSCTSGSKYCRFPDNAEFLIHLGDIRSAQKENACVLSDYQDIATVLKLSRVPVFLVPGGK
jgi:hypothetical protein